MIDEKRIIELTLMNHDIVIEMAKIYEDGTDDPELKRKFIEIRKRQENNKKQYQQRLGFN